MRQHKAGLILSHGKNMWHARRKVKIYAIIMAPEFGNCQIFGADEDSIVYEIGMYDNMVERVGGNHGGIPTRASAPRPTRQSRANCGRPDRERPCPAGTRNHRQRVFDAGLQGDKRVLRPAHGHHGGWRQGCLDE